MYPGRQKMRWLLQQTQNNPNQRWSRVAHTFEIQQLTTHLCMCILHVINMNATGQKSPHGDTKTYPEISCVLGSI